MLIVYFVKYIVSNRKIYSLDKYESSLSFILSNSKTHVE